MRYPRARLAATLGAVILLAACVPEDQSSSAAGPGQTAHATGLALTFPQDWHITDGDAGSLLTARAPRDTPQDLFVQNVTVRMLPRGTKEVAPGFIERHEAAAAAALPGYALAEQTDTTLDGQPARRSVFTYQNSRGMWIKALAYTVAADRRGYSITCSAEEGKFDVYKNRFENICRSLHLEALSAPTLGQGAGSLIPAGG